MTERKPKFPIDLLMDGVKWEPIPYPPEFNTAQTYATHEGVLNIMDFKFRVYQLNTGQRIINYEDLAKFFGVNSLSELAALEGGKVG